MVAKPEPIPIERDKVEINPDIDFGAVAARDLAEIPKNEIAMFKWTGIYHQLEYGFFMLRVRIPGGLLSAEQLEGLADLAQRYGQAELCLTTRQTVQLHWVRRQDLPQVLAGLQALGLDSKNACGDVSRNVVTCPLQGVCPHEVGDVRSTLLALANDPEIRDRQRNLPRKHKLSVAGCGRACGQTLMNCQGWHPVSRPTRDGGTERGFRQYVGGGLGARPYLGQLIFDWVPEELVLEVTRATVELYRRLGNRRVRALARLKVVVAELGARRFAEAVLGVLRERDVPGLEALEPAGQQVGEILPSFLEGQAVVRQRQPGYSTVRAIVPRAELTTEAAQHIAAWARTYGDGSILLTSRQNVSWRFVPDRDVPAFLAELAAHGWAVAGFEHAPDLVACVGTTLCNLAVSDTPATYRSLYRALSGDPEFWHRVGPLRIHMNGCPNSCAQHWIADIGLRGMRREGARGSEEGYTVCVGGSLEGTGRMAQPICDVPASEVVDLVRRLLELYLERRNGSGERFGAFATRLGAPALAELLGTVSAPREAVNVRNLRLGRALRVLVDEVRHDQR